MKRGCSFKTPAFPPSQTHVRKMTLHFGPACFPTFIPSLRGQCQIPLLSHLSHVTSLGAESRSTLTSARRLPVAQQVFAFATNACFPLVPFPSPVFALDLHPLADIQPFEHPEFFMGPRESRGSTVAFPLRPSFALRLRLLRISPTAISPPSAACELGR